MRNGGADDAQPMVAGRIMRETIWITWILICKNDELGRGLRLIYVDPPFFEKYQASVVLQSEILGNSSTVESMHMDDFRASALDLICRY